MEKIGDVRIISRSKPLKELGKTSFVADIEVYSQDDVAALLSTHLKETAALVHDVKVLRIRPQEGLHTLNGMESTDLIVNPPLPYILPWHIDIRASNHPVTSTLSFAFPEGWATDLHCFWQTSCDRGRNSSTLHAPAAPIAECLTELIQIPAQELKGKEGFQDFEEDILEAVIEGWWHLLDKLKKRDDYNKYYHDGDMEKIMALRDLQKIFFENDMPLHVKVIEQITRSTIDQNQHCILETNWSLPENTRGLVVLASNGANMNTPRPLAHTRWDRDALDESNLTVYRVTYAELVKHAKTLQL